MHEEDFNDYDFYKHFNDEEDKKKTKENAENTYVDDNDISFNDEETNEIDENYDIYEQQSLADEDDNTNESDAILAEIIAEEEFVEPDEPIEYYNVQEKIVRLSRIRPSDDAISFSFKEGGTPVSCKQINITEDNVLENIVTQYDEVIPFEEIQLNKYLLEVPGVGYLAPGTKIYYADKKNRTHKPYILQFGWHTNVSNQTLYTWYLEPIEDDIPPKTVYKEMVEDIGVITFD